MAALPPLSKIALDNRGRDIWPILLNAESQALPSPAKYKNTLIGVRVVGYLLLDVWEHQDVNPFGLTPYRRILTEVESCVGVDAIYALGLMYRNNLMRLFRSNTGPLPSPSPHPSRPSFEIIREDAIELMKAASQTKPEIKKIALFRDGFRCMLTGQFDRDTKRATTPEYQGPAINTQCAHLFSESAQDAGKPTDVAGTAFAILKLFGLGDVVERLMGGKVNTLINVLTIGSDLHRQFDAFQLWLDLVPGKPNSYKICFLSEIFASDLRGAPREVTFSLDPDAVKACQAENKELVLELPNRSLIAVRSACARVAHMSGAAEYVETTHRDEDNIMVLSGPLGQNVAISGSLLQAPVQQKLVSVS